MKLEERFPESAEKISTAREFARQKHRGQKRKSGEDFVSHPFAVAEILAEEGLGAETILAALLHDTLEDTSATADEIREGWGCTVAELVEGITKVERATERERKAETYRKLLLAAASDARVLVIKLADRLHNMRTIDALPPDSQKRVAEETLQVYTPIAHRLGLSRIQHELENRALRVLRPEDYLRAESLQRELRSAGTRELRRLQGQLRRALRGASLEGFQIRSRIKSIYSIAEKMRLRQATEIWDVLGLRVVLQNREDCYRALGVVHQIWKPLPEHFDDYIAVPRGGLYQSLHTTVMTPRGKPLEVQIRSSEMDELAERGLAAHWLYKEDLREGGPRETRRYIQQAARAESLEGNSLEEVFRDLRSDTFAREIYLFTPEGDIRFLPEGSTALDFAFAIHTEVGLRCSGARVDGKLHPLSRALPAGAQVEILLDPETSPSRDWLQHVHSTKARSRIRAFLAEQEEEGRAPEGWERIRQALREQNMKPLADNLFESLERAGYDDPEEAGRRALRNQTLLREIVRKVVRASSTNTTAPAAGRAEEEIEIEGMQGVLVRRAGCCRPLPGQMIVGYVSLGRGVSVHLRDCASVKEWQKSAPERLLEARWRDSSIVLRPKIYLWKEGNNLPELLRILSARGNEIENLHLDREGNRLLIEAEVRLARRENEELLRAELGELPGLVRIDF